MTTFVATTGDDIFQGTASTEDTVDYSRNSSAGAGVVVDLTAGGSQATSGSGTDTFTSIEGLIGTVYRDFIKISGTDNYHLELGGGNDWITSASGIGAWTLDGGDGEDYWFAELDTISTPVTFTFDSLTLTGTLTGGTTLKNIEHFEIDFGTGDDTIIITNGLGYSYNGTKLNGGAGADTFIIDGFHDQNNLVSGGYDLLGGPAATDTLTLDLTKGETTAPVTYISANNQSNEMGLSIAGSDSFGASNFEHLNYTADNGDNRIVINSLPEFESNISLHVDAAGGNDGLEMDMSGINPVSNVVWTISGSHTTTSNIGYFDNFETINLHLGGGTNVLNMGNEADTIYSTAGNDTVNAGGGDDYIEALFYGHPAKPVTYKGEGGNDTLIGNAGNDFLYGGDGADYINGKGGADQMTGGADNDTYYIDTAGDQVAELKNEGTDTIFSSISLSLGSQYIEDMTLTGVTNLNGTGNGLDNVLTGNSGDNILNGSGGADSMFGGGGSDTYYVDTVDDHVTELRNEGSDTIISTVSFSLASQYIENLTLSGKANTSVSGNGLDNILTGNSANNILNGSGGADIMSGDLGNDTYYIDNAGDHAIELRNEGTDTVYASISFSLGLQYIENLTLLGAENFNGNGNGLNNILIGNNGNNKLNGGGGNDTLTGGAGSDTFFFGTGSGVDMITDFSAPQNDSLNLHAYDSATAVFMQVGADTVIDLGGGNIITIANIQKADVTSHVIW